MMKKLASALVALCLMVVTPLASADEVVLFKNASGDGWSAFEKDLVAEKHLVNGVFPSAVLAQIAHGHAKSKSLPGGEKPLAEFTKLFKLANNLGDTITVADFRQLGQAGKIVLPPMVERQASTEVVPATVAQAPVAATAASASTATSVAVEKENAQLVKLESDLANLKEELVKVQKSITKSGGDQKQVNTKIAEIDSQKTQLNILKRRLDDFEEKGVVSPGMRAKITEMETRLGNLDLETKSLIGKVEIKLNPRFSAIENSVGWQSKALAVLAAALVAAVWFIGRIATSAKKDAERSLDKAKAVEESLEVVHGQIGKPDIKIHEALIGKLQTLQFGERWEGIVKVDGQPITLGFIGATNGVKIEGIASQQNAVRFDNVIKRIKRAVGAGDLIGIHQSAEARLHVV